jgi:hypothetical protein
MTEFLRIVRSAQLQTPVLRYVHPDSRRRVTVIGGMHVGDPGFFARLRTVIDGLHAAGAVVQCEGSGLLPYADADADDAERQVLADLGRCRELEKRRIAELGWVGQADGLGYPPDWQIIDLTNLEIVRLAGVDVMAEGVRRMTKQFDWPEDDRNGITRFRLAVAMTLRVMAIARGMDAYRKADPANGVLLGARTSTALDGVDTTDRHVVLIWGAMHLPGIDAGLTARGFVRTGEPQWFTVAQLPSIRSAIWRSLAGSLRRTPTSQR